VWQLHAGAVHWRPVGGRRSGVVEADAFAFGITGASDQQAAGIGLVMAIRGKAACKPKPSRTTDISALVGLCVRALISLMTFAFDPHRRGRRPCGSKDYYPKGKRHEMPAHHNLEQYLDTYIEAAGIGDSGKSPLFRSAIGRTCTLAATAMNRVDAWRMIQRRAAELGLRVKIGCHTFRATGITAYLEAGGTLENAQAMAAHESPRTTKLYDRTGDEITLDEIERIAI
jgi:integrase/recombinase XerD